MGLFRKKGKDRIERVEALAESLDERTTKVEQRLAVLQATVDVVKRPAKAVE